MNKKHPSLPSSTTSMHNLEKIKCPKPLREKQQHIYIYIYIYSYHSYDEIHSNLENSVPAYTKSELVHDSIVLRHKDNMQISNTYNRNIHALYEHYIRR